MIPTAVRNLLVLPKGKKEEKAYLLIFTKLEVKHS